MSRCRREGIIILGGNSFRYIVGPGLLHKLTVDLNGNGQILLNDEAYIITKGDVASGKGGAIFNIGVDSFGFAQQTPASNFESYFTTLSRNIEEPVIASPPSLVSDEITYIHMFSVLGNRIDLEIASLGAAPIVASNYELLQDPQSPELSKVRSRYGALYQLYSVVGQPKEFSVEYPESQVEVKAYAVYKNTFLCGDVNLDGRVDVVDALMSAQASAGVFTLGREQQRAADVNHSGFVDIIDALLISRYSSGLPITLACPV